MSKPNQSDFFEVEQAIDDEALAENLRTRGVDLAGSELAVELSDTPETHTVPSQQNLKITDGSLPIADPRREQFLIKLAQGASSVVAYWEAVNATVSKKSAQEQASRWLKRADMQARLRFLIRSGKTRLKGHEAEAAAGTGNAGEGPAMQNLTKEDLIAHLERIVSSSNNESSRLAAIDRLNKLKGFVKDPAAIKNRPDPIYLGDFLRQAAENHMDPQEAARAIHERGEDPFEGNRENAPQQAAEAAAGAQNTQAAGGGAQDVGGAA